jgi:hypothetical protein
LFQATKTPKDGGKPIIALSGFTVPSEIPFSQFLVLKGGIKMYVLLFFQHSIQNIM